MIWMDTEVKQKASAPLGLIACLTGGFEFVGRNLWLVIPPVLLDLFLWLGPRLSVASLVEGFVRLMRGTPTPDAATAQQLSQAIGLLEELGQQFNLFSVLTGLPLLSVPSLLVGQLSDAASPLGPVSVVAPRGVFAPLVLLVVLTGCGLLLGTLYLAGLASRMVAVRSLAERARLSGLADQPDSTPAFSLKRWVRAIVFAGVLIGVGGLIVPLWLLVVALIFMVVPSFGFIFWLFSMGALTFVLLHLLFVVHGVLLGGRAISRALWESVLLVRTQLGAVVGLVALSFLIYQGLGFVWVLPKGDSWALLVGMIGNSCIATGLTAATFVFYQARLPATMEMLRARQIAPKA